MPVCSTVARGSEQTAPEAWTKPGVRNVIRRMCDRRD